ncbi:MAG: carbohydrate kinase family protein [Chloroflexota bacterium]
MTLSYDFVLIGGYFFDMIFTGLANMPVLGCELYSDGVTTTGGAMFITAASLRRLGASVGWPVIFGNDYYSQFVHDLSLQEGIDLSLAKHLAHPYRRVTTSMAHAGERAFVTYTDPEISDSLEFELACLEQCNFRHLHFGGLTSLEYAKPLLEKARQSGATVSMDCQDAPPLHKTNFPWGELLPMLDIFIPNAREALLITKAATVPDALKQLTKHCKLVVIKDGANGAWIGDGEKVIHAPSVAVPQVIDTTGAGDCFNAGFLYGHIIEGAPLETSGLYGNICGGLSVTGVGGATHAPTLEQLKAFLLAE